MPCPCLSQARGLCNFGQLNLTSAKATTRIRTFVVRTFDKVNFIRWSAYQYGSLLHYMARFVIGFMYLNLITSLDRHKYNQKKETLSLFKISLCCLHLSTGVRKDKTTITELR